MGDTYNREGCLLIVQADHLSGETVGVAINDLYEAGALNVNVMQTITKKNRPGMVFLIDCLDEDKKIEEVILGQLGVYGWQRIKTDHKHVPTQIIVKQISFEQEEETYTFHVRVKRAKSEIGPIRPENDDCLCIRNQLRDKGIYLSLDQVRMEIIRQIGEQG